MQYVVSLLLLLLASLCYFLIIQLMFFLNILVMFVFCFVFFLLSILCNLCSCVVLCTVSPFVLSLSSFRTGLPTTAAGWKSTCSQ